MRDVAIIGIGLIDFGELWTKSLRDIFVEASLNAIDDAGVDHIDSMFVGSMAPGLFTGQEHIGALLADYLGAGPIPATRVESACASGGLSLRCAYTEVASGMSDIVLAGGVEKMTDVSGNSATDILATAADGDYEAFMGVTFPALYAMMASAHMEKYKTTREDLAHVAVKNHNNGSLNPHAQYPFKVTVEQVLKSPRVAEPLGLLDCSPVTDGAAAVILCPVDIAKKIAKKKQIVKISASSFATDTFALHQRKDITSLESTVRAAEKAYKMAGCKPSDIQLAEVHDCFTIAEIMVIEALGFVEKGKGGSAARNGITTLDGKIPVNTSGGLKAKGHPVGATGIAQACEIVEQLRGDAGKRQIKKARLGLTQNMGGTGASSIVHIMEAI